MTTIPQSISRPAAGGMMMGNLYFAYGSNLRLAQMARRCPRSSPVGRGILCGYRWQINQRGFANVVPAAPAAAVEGLLYSVDDPEDMETLDACEGVSTGAYERRTLVVEFEPVVCWGEELSGVETSELAGRKMRDDERRKGMGVRGGGGGGRRRSARLAVVAGGQQHDPAIHREGDAAVEQPDEAPAAAAVRGGHPVQALVYLSERYSADGTIRDEYVSRMEQAIADGTALGALSGRYVEECMMPAIRGSPVYAN